MKVLGIVCSPRKGGNTEIMVSEALIGARSYGAESELWTAAGKELKPCDACESCQSPKNSGECNIKDDMQELYPKILAADGIVFGSPSYYLTVTAQAKVIIDRLYSLFYQYVLAGKIVGLITVATSAGHAKIWDQFSFLIVASHMILADYAWGFAKDKGQIREDRFAMKASELLGKEVVSVIKQGFRWPEEFKKPIYRIVQDDYKIPSYPPDRVEERR